MKEIRSILNAYQQALAAEKQTALVTVVHVEGSSYRRPGARMLVTDDGEITGAISGGCLEGDALRKAQLVIAQQRPKLVVYDTRDEEDAYIGRQLGCAGVITVLFEPIDPSDPLNAIECLKQINDHRTTQFLVTIFSLNNKDAHQPGTCYWKQEAQSWGKISEGLNAQTIFEDHQRKGANFLQYENGYTVFVEAIQPVIALVLIGAGNDVRAVSQFAEVLGWQVQIADGRSTHAREERFPVGCQILVGKPEQIIENINLDDRTAVVLMTHNYQYDLAMLRLLIHKELPYIGVLGPAKKLSRMLDDLKCNTSANMFGPTGLNIGAETPEEIALSIVSEIQAVMYGKTGGHLRSLEHTIHDRSKTLIQIS